MKKMFEYPTYPEPTNIGEDPFSDLILKETQLSPNQLAYSDTAHGVWLYHANCLAIMDSLIARFPEGIFDMIFADPPYFLSNGGVGRQTGKMVNVDKGDWDKSNGVGVNHEFNCEWLRRCQALLKPDGTIWVSGTQNVIFSIGYAMQQLDMKILNDIVWERPNPSAKNLAGKYFSQSTETILWAAKNQQSKPLFNSAELRQDNGGKSMKNVWRFAAPGSAEKVFGKHPAQKPLKLVERCVLASTAPGGFVFDPFNGSATSGVAAIKHGRRYMGVELEKYFVELSVKRLEAEMVAK